MKPTIERTSRQVIENKLLARPVKWKRIICFFLRHPVTPTGRRGIHLVEYRCNRCLGIYIGHDEYRDFLIPYSKDVELFFRGEWREK